MIRDAILFAWDASPTVFVLVVGVWAGHDKFVPVVCENALSIHREADLRINFLCVLQRVLWACLHRQRLA